MVTPIMINNITWRTYLIFMATNISFVPMIYYLFPETKVSGNLLARGCIQNLKASRQALSMFKPESPITNIQSQQGISLEDIDLLFIRDEDVSDSSEPTISQQSRGKNTLDTKETSSSHHIE
jgi:hypothetical protein